MGIWLQGLEYFLPEKIASIDELARIERFQSDLPMIKDTLGYRQVHVATQDDNVALAVRAGRLVLERHGIDAHAIDAVVVCGHFEDAEWQRISTCRIHSDLALRPDCTVFDVKTGNCTGAFQGIAVARGLLAGFGFQHVLVLCADKLNTRFVRRRIGRRVFGDGACGFVVTPGGGELELIGRPQAVTDPRFLRIDKLTPDIETEMLASFRAAAATIVGQALDSAGVKAADVGLIFTTNYEARFWARIFQDTGLNEGAWRGDGLASIGHVPVSDPLINYVRHRVEHGVEKGSPVLFLSVGLGVSAQAFLTRAA